MLHGCDRELIFNVVSQLRSMEIPITSIWKPSPKFTIDVEKMTYVHTVMYLIFIIWGEVGEEIFIHMCSLQLLFSSLAIKMLTKNMD